MTKTRSQSSKRLSLTVRRTYRATPERIFRAFTDPAELTRWFCPEQLTVPEADFEPTVGGKVRVVMEAPDGARHIANGVVREVRRPEKLVFTWQWESGMEGFTGETTITIDIRPVNDGTEVVLTHAGLPTKSQRENHAQGWQSALENLQKRGL